MSTLTILTNGGSVGTEGSIGENDTSGSAWATIIGETGNTSVIGPGGGGLTAENYIFIGAYLTLNTWQYLNRYGMTFDTSSIGNGQTISSATLSIFINFKTDLLSITPDINVYGWTPTSNTTIQNSDFSKVTGTAMATAIPYSSINVNGGTGIYNTFTLNAAGIANINKTGYSRFSIRNANYDVSGTVPTWGVGSNYSYIGGDGATYSKLVVTYAPTPSGGNLLSIL